MRFAQYKGHRRRSGFTLTEVVVAAVLLVIGFMAVLATLSMSRRIASLSENRLAAKHIARGVIEDLRNQDYFGPRLAVGTHLLPGNRGRYVVTDAGDGWTRNITVTILWVEPSGSQHEVALTTSFSRSLHR